MQIFFGIIVLLAVVVVAAVIAALAIGAIRTSRQRGSGTLGNAMMAVHSLLEPEKRHAVKSMRVERKDEDESGDDDPPR